MTAVRAHERTHSDARPYACCRCEKTFKTSECLWHHKNRNKTCGRATPTGGRCRPPRSDETNMPSVRHTSSRRRQRRGRAVSHASSPLTNFDCRSSTMTSAAAVAATSLTHFEESSSAEASTSLSNAACYASDAGSGVVSDVQPETEMADLFDLWTTSDSVASQSLYVNVDVNFYSSAGSFDDVIASTSADSAVSGSSCDTAKVTGGCDELPCNGAVPTDMLSHDERHRQSSFVAARSDAAFQTVSGYSELRPLYCQTTTGGCTHHSTCAYDEQLISNRSTVIDTYDSGRSSKQLPANSQTLVESAGSSDAFCGSCLPLRKRDRRPSITSSPRQHVISPPPAKTFYLPPIETFAPTRQRPQPLLSTWS